jgi:hypothetical protein
VAVLGRLLISSAERLDLPDLLSIDSYAAGDWKYFLKGLVGNEKPYILKGFDIIDPQNAIGTQSCSIRVADSIVFYPTSDAGSFYHGLPEGNTNALPLVPELRKNAVNYVYLTFSTFNTSVDSRSFWDPDKDGGTGGEFTQDVNTESVLIVNVGVSTGSFPTNTIPVAKVTVGPVVITAIQDARDMMFRLGSGGISPDPFSTYSFRSLPAPGYERKEPLGTMTSSSDPNPFQGADKNIYSLKEWMDVVMTKLLELGGTTYWYEDTSATSLVNIFTDALTTTLKSKGQWLHSSATPGLLTWSEDLQLKLINSPKDTIIRAGNKTLANEQVMYIDLVRRQPFNGTDQPVAWTNGQPYINTIGGAIGLFANLSKGDWVKREGDADNRQLRVEEFYDSINMGGATTTAALAKSVRLNDVYAGPTTNEKGRYDKGVYLASDVQIADRDSSALATAGGNLHWLALRSDTIQNISNIDSFELNGTIVSADGTTAEVNSVAHGMQDGDYITVTAPVAQAGTYIIEVENADTFYFNTTNTTTGALTSFYAIATTTTRDNGYGLQLESANHGFSSGDTIIIAGTTNYNGSVLVNKRNATNFQFAYGSNQASETAGTATLAKIQVRVEEGLTKIIQGESVDIGDLDTENLRQYIGMQSTSQTHPVYVVPTDYNALNGKSNFNSLTTDNLTERVSKLTAMMADKAQDKTIKILPQDIDLVDNTTNGTNQDISFTSFSATPILNVATPGSDGGVTITLSGTLTLAANEVAYFTLDRNNPTTIANLSGLTVADLTTMPVEENIFIIAFRLSGTAIWLWDGTYCPAGTTSLTGGGSGSELAEESIALRNALDSSYLKYLTPSVFASDKSVNVDAGNTTATFSSITKTYNFIATQVLRSINLLDSSFYEEARDVDAAMLTAFWDNDNVDTGATYQLSRDNGVTWQTVTMQRNGLTGEYSGVKQFAAETFSTAGTLTDSADQVLNKTTAQQISQRLVLTDNRVVSEFTFKVNKAGSPAGNLTINLVKDSGGNPSSASADLISFVDVRVIDVSSGISNLVVNFGKQALKAGTYHVVFTTDSSYKDSFSAGVTQLAVRSDAAGADPLAKSYDGTSWSNITGQSVKFTYKYKILSLLARITASMTARLKGFGVLYSTDDKLVTPVSLQNIIVGTPAQVDAGLATHNSLQNALTDSGGYCNAAQHDYRGCYLEPE